MKVNLVQIPAPPQSVDQLVGLYEKAITPRTKVLMVSHITYVTGLVSPVKELTELAHRKGILISVDGAHPLGMLQLDLKSSNFDHYCGGRPEVADVRHRHRRLLRQARAAGSHLAADGAARRSEGRREEVRVVRPARRAERARDGRGARPAARDRQEERRGPRPLPLDAAARRPEGRSRREALDVERSGAGRGADRCSRSATSRWPTCRRRSGTTTASSSAR